MPKIKDQNIPAELYTLYKDTVKFPMLTGFNQEGPPGVFTPINTVGKKPPKKASASNSGLGWNSAGPRALMRYAFQLIGKFWNANTNTGGVEPPYTGPRSRNWWKGNTPVTLDGCMQFYSQQSMTYLRAGQFAPWQMENSIYVPDLADLIISDINGNDGTTKRTLGAGGDIPFTFQSLGTLSTDKNFFWVVDSVAGAVYKFAKDSLSHIDTITSYANNEIAFVNIKDAMSDGRYLYIADTSKNYYIKQSITDPADFTLMPLKKIGADKTPTPERIYISRGYVHIWDPNNRYIQIYDKLTNQFIDRQRVDSTKIFFANNIYGWWVANCDTKLITLYIKGGFITITTIGVGGETPLPLESIDGFHVSGDILSIVDNTDKKIYQINMTNFELIETIDISGRFNTIGTTIAEPQEFFYYD